MLRSTILYGAFLGILLTPSSQAAEKIDKDKLVGNWTLVSINNTTPDGKTFQGFGLNDGMLVFGANGSFVQALVRSDLPKFKSDNRNTGTADEDKGVIEGSLTFFGTYTVNNDDTFSMHIIRSTFPNWDNTDQKRIVVSLTGDELKWHNPAATVGGTTETVWKRSK
jgi:hypothetical protein